MGMALDSVERCAPFLVVIRYPTLCTTKTT